jgi:DNA topoisomerase-1
VQSVAVRLVVDREREIQAFQPEEYWTLHARLRGQHPPEFVAALREVDGQKPTLPSEEPVRALIETLAGVPFVVRSVTRGERRRNPAPPFITSTLQQDAGRKLGFSARKTMTVAQQLYEGVELGGDGAVGLITYMRTDSVRVAGDAQEETRAWVAARLGAEYLPEAPPVYRSRGSAQEAHEAIRPSEVRRDPKSVTRFLTRDQLALYRLIWERFVASQLLPAVYDTVVADIEAGRCLFRAQGATLRFKGFMAVYVESREEAAPPRTTTRPRRCPRWPRGRRSRCWASIPGSTSPSHRRGTPRRRSSRPWRSSGSAARPPMPPSSAPS